VHVLLRELRHLLVKSQQIVDHEDLRVRPAPRADPDRGDLELLRDLRTEVRRHRLEHDRERPRLLERMSLVEDLRRGLTPSLDAVATQAIDRLRRQSDVRHHGDLVGVPEHVAPDGVTDQQHRDPGSVEDLGRREVVSREHRPASALGLPGTEIVDRDGHLLAPPWSARRTTRESTATLFERFDVSTGRYGERRDQEEAIQMTDTMQHEPWAQLLTLGDARFGILAGGPFDGRCYPIAE